MAECILHSHMTKKLVAAALISHLSSMATEFEKNGAQDTPYDEPYTTLTTNLIRGGNAYETIPNLCEFIFEFRNLATDNSDALHQSIVNYIETKMTLLTHGEQAEACVTLDTIAKAPGLDTSQSELIVQAAQAICHGGKVLKVAYATGAGSFRQAKIPDCLWSW